MVALNIKLNGSTVVFAGKTLTGSVIVHKVIPCKALTLRLLGRGETSWGDGESAHHGSCEEYINLKQTLWTYDGGKPLVSGKGYAFGITLPEDLPPTFRGHYGSIKYVLTATLECSNPSLDKNSIDSLTVISFSPVCNVHQMLLEAQTVKKEKKINLTCDGCISAKVTLPMSKYVLGESIMIFADVLNRGNVAVKKTTASLVQTLIYSDGRGSKSERAVVCKVKRGEIAPGMTYAWVSVPLVIPKTISPSDFGPMCSLFRAEHCVEFTVYIAGIEEKLVFDVTLGTVCGREPDTNRFVTSYLKQVSPQRARNGCLENEMDVPTAEINALEI